MEFLKLFAVFEIGVLAGICIACFLIGGKRHDKE